MFVALELHTPPSLTRGEYRARRGDCVPQSPARLVSGLSAAIVAWAAVLAIGFGSETSAYAQVTESEASGTEDEVPAERSEAPERSGPTVHLSYNPNTAPANPLAVFMYFVPLISLTQMELETNADNEQKVGFVSYDRRSSANSFIVTCDFEIQGTGFHNYLFDPVRMIEVHTEDLAEGETLTGMLDYIKSEGAGFGRIQVEGVIDDSTETVHTVRVQFNMRGHTSPVTIGLYDIEPEDGEYTYENRSNELIARVNELVFTRGGDPPRMGLSVNSIEKPESSGGFFSRVVARVKGVIANLTIDPTRIAPLGQETMLEFGEAIRNRDTEFTFPFADGLMKVEEG